MRQNNFVSFGKALLDQLYKESWKRGYFGCGDFAAKCSTKINLSKPQYFSLREVIQQDHMVSNLARSATLRSVAEKPLGPWVTHCAVACRPLHATLPVNVRTLLRSRLYSSSPSSLPNIKEEAARARQRAALTASAQAKASSSGSSKSAAYYLLAIIVGMVGMTYASVPLYRLFCQATGYGGTITRVKSVEEKLVDHESFDEASAKKIAERQLKITFNSDVTDGMPWKFSPSQREVRVVPGQTVLAFYKAHNFSDKAITGVSTYNVTPMKAGIYFNKIQCFCFEEQRLRAGEEVDMPVFFYIDPELALDPKMKDIDTLTLSYTFFPVSEE